MLTSYRSSKSCKIVGRGKKWGPMRVEIPASIVQMNNHMPKNDYTLHIL